EIIQPDGIVVKFGFTMELKAEKRDVVNQKAKKIRLQGFIPAEVYGHRLPNVHLSLLIKDFERAYRSAGEHAIISLSIDGSTKPVIIHEVQRDAVSGAVMAVDFYEVKMDEKIKTPIPIKLVGESPAVKNLGGILVKAMDEVEVEALPGNLPEAIEVDISKLANLNDSLYVSDFPKSDKFSFIVDPRTVVVTVSEPTEEEAVTQEISPESVVVESEEKRAKREANAQEENEAKA
ncbi:MAG TPA: 50S ribosomal protein L25, partial [Candidatus Tyrphobacter sp.]|nr:50S ribosomal protein L25 [Candidatus Tyrphobacter sp.]